MDKPAMFSTHKVASAKDEWSVRKESKYSEKRKTHRSSYNDVCTINVHDDFESVTGNPSASKDKRQRSYVTFTQRQDACGSSKSSVSSSTDFLNGRNPRTPDADSRGKSTREDISDKWYDPAFRETYFGSDGDASTSCSGKDSAFTCNSCSQEDDYLNFSKTNSDGTRTKGTGFGQRNVTRNNDEAKPCFSESRCDAKQRADKGNSKGSKKNHDKSNTISSDAKCKQEDRETLGYCNTGGTERPNLHKRNGHKTPDNGGDDSTSRCGEDSWDYLTKEMNYTKFSQTGSEHTGTRGAGFRERDKIDRSNDENNSEKLEDGPKESFPSRCGVGQGVNNFNPKGSKKNRDGKSNDKSDTKCTPENTETLGHCDADETKNRHLGEREGEKTSKNNHGEKIQHDRLNNSRRGPKRAVRGRKKNVQKKPCHVSEENIKDVRDTEDVRNTANVDDKANDAWLPLDLLADLYKEGVLAIQEAFPACVSAGYSVLWYLMVLSVLTIPPVIYWLVMCIKWFSVFILNQVVRVLKADYKAFLKRYRLRPSEPPKRRPEPVGLGIGADEIVCKLLASKDLDAYRILGVSEQATDDEIKRRYRDMAKIVHPDKNSHKDSEEAFKILQSAFDLISDEKKRMAYEFENDKKKLEEEFEDLIDLMKKRVDEIKKMIMCNACNKTHPRLLTDRFVYAARYCADCQVRHSAKEGDVWVETSHMGFKYYCYLCMDKQVFEVTEWGACQGLLSTNRANTHMAYFSVKPNRTSSPWDDLFGDSEQPAYQPNQNKKRRQKSKAKASGKNKKR